VVSQLPKQKAVVSKRENMQIVARSRKRVRKFLKYILIYFVILVPSTCIQEYLSIFTGALLCVNYLRYLIECTVSEMLGQAGTWMYLCTYLPRYLSFSLLIVVVFKLKIIKIIVAVFFFQCFNEREEDESKKFIFGQTSALF